MIGFDPLQIALLFIITSASLCVGITLGWCVLWLARKVKQIFAYMEHQLATGGDLNPHRPRVVKLKKPYWYDYILPSNTPKCDRCHIQPATKTNRQEEELCVGCR